MRTAHRAGIAATLLAAVVIVPASAAAPSRDAPRAEPAGAEVELTAFNSCDGVLDTFKRAALSRVGPFGIPERSRLVGGGLLEAGDEVAVRDAQAAAPSHSTTNVHEPGVDEPDVVKTDGRRIVTAMDGTLRVIDARTKRTTALVELPGSDVAGLFLHGDRALVILGAGGHRLSLGGHGYGGTVELIQVDLSGEGSITGRLEIDGAYLDARQSGRVARIVVRSGHRLRFEYPSEPLPAETVTRRTAAQAEARNRQIVRRSTVEDWLPSITVSDGRHRSSRLLDCSAVRTAAGSSPTSLLTVLTVDVGAELGDGDPLALAADGATVYGTSDALYVAGGDPTTGPTGPDGAHHRTSVYQFDTSGTGKPRHVASGSVEGSVLNQYALSGHDGVLRIATTTRGSGLESAVTVLRKQGDRLVRIGHVGGLGKGERIYSVRYLGDTGYVVTFRETDPLYRIDLSDPRRPRVAGELKITGYSSYLHPVGDDRLLGVGQEATERGRTTGTQVSLFDIRAEPKRVDRHYVAGGYSDVEFDPHAFLYWPQRDIVAVPIRTRHGSEPGPRAAVSVLRLDGDALTEVGRVEHPEASGGLRHGISRCVVIGDTLWTVSPDGAMASDLDDLDRTAWLPFG